MARCGCGGGQCNCTVVAGPGTTVDGSGSVANPYIVSAKPPTCDQVRPCFSAGNGAAYDPVSGVISARPSTDAGNNLEFGSDGGLLVPGGVDCAQVRPCFSAGDGAAYDPATGVVSARPSTQAGNNLAIGPDGGLYVPTGSATVTTGCGLTGDGSGAAPVTVATGTWPYACDIDTAGTVIACGSDGVLRGEPRGRASFVSYTEIRDYPDITVPSGSVEPGDTFTTTVTNPDPCLPALLLVEREVDVDFNLPVGAGAAYTQDTDEMVYLRNTGTTAITDTHVQTTKLYQHTLALAPGATATINLPVNFSRGSGGATYNRIQVFIRALLISQ
ncbi:hypothetical protein PH213_20245 [Streptomyces sp. SRF1]|uniref:hypothetical protein n=1 Tax=Streptomyces sp. SRF1 TaxID=1549642 RepID=UPI0025B1E73A|nr:hypothetical protein [Streptomyces sp. SRF1]MDN3056837.1 hypothetical protein [Streptomyces sp. SRF1]